MGTIIGLTFGKTAGSADAKDRPAEKLACPHCGKEYKSADALEKHIADKHPAAAEPEEAPEADGEAPAVGKE